MIVTSGGVLSGAFVKLLAFLLSKIGAWIVIVLFFIADLFFASGIPLSAIFAVSRDKKPQPKREKGEFYKDFKDEIIYGQEKEKNVSTYEADLKEYDGNASIKAQIDIPVDPPINEKKRKIMPGFFNKNRNVATPAEYITGDKPQVSDDEIQEVINEEMVPGFPSESDGVVAAGPAEPVLDVKDDAAADLETESESVVSNIVEQ